MKYIKGIKYITTENEWFQTTIFPERDIITEYIELYADSKMLIKKGYSWDGPSGPTIDTKNSMTPSLGHDALAQLMRMDRLPRRWRLQSNKDFYRWLRERGMWWVRAITWLRMLNKFGGPSTDPRNKRAVHEAP